MSCVDGRREEGNSKEKYSDIYLSLHMQNPRGWSYLGINMQQLHAYAQ